jgi:FkbM family methyltransferase
MISNKLMSKPLGISRYIRTFQNWWTVIATRKDRCPGMLALRDGTRLSLSNMSEEIWAFWNIYGEHCYSRDFNGISHDGIVLDLGANVGIFSRYAANHMVPNGHVIAVEPNPELIRFLRSNVSGRTEIIPKAIALGSGCATLYVTKSSLASSLYDDGHEPAVPIEVASNSFADLITKHPHIALLKCNAEGIEYPLLLETEPDLWRCIERVAIKYHEGDLVGVQNSTVLASRIRELGYKVHRHDTLWKSGVLTTGIITASR